MFTASNVGEHLALINGCWFCNEVFILKCRSLPNIYTDTIVVAVGIFPWSSSSLQNTLLPTLFVYPVDVCIANACGYARNGRVDVRAITKKHERKTPVTPIPCLALSLTLNGQFLHKDS